LTVKDRVLTDTPERRTRERQVEAVTAAVAQHVRALRQARGWSLDELSGRSGVSKGMVVQIEGARTNPSVGTLSRIAEAFGVSIARLLEPAAERTVRISVAHDAPTLWRGGFGGLGRLLAGANDPDVVELWEWRLEPHDRHDSPDHSPGTRELIHVLAGEVTVTVEGNDHLVRAGETIDFVADKAHAYRNDGQHSARLLMVVLIPPDSFGATRPR
jgi:transcriptional regulator with XRE-family HTH domain